VPAPLRVTWFIDGLLAGRECRFLLDTGAEFTVVRHGLLPPVSVPSIHALGAFKHSAPTALRGPHRVTAALPGAELSIVCYEGDTHEQCLLGGDFVATHVTNIDVTNDVLVLHDGVRVPLIRVSTPPADIVAVLEVHCDHRTVLPPHTAATIYVSVSGSDVLEVPVADGHPPLPRASPTPLVPELAIPRPREGVALKGYRGDAGHEDAPLGSAPRDAACGTVGAPRDAACGTVGATREPTCGPVASSGAPRDRTCGPVAASGTPGGEHGSVAAGCRYLGVAADGPVRVLRTRCAPRPVDLPPGLKVTSTLLAGDSGRALVMTVRNEADRPLTLSRGTLIDTLEVHALLPAYHNAATMAGDAGATPAAELPQPLQELLADCSANLTEQESSQVRLLLIEFQDVFSCGGEIGHCTIVEHDIDTGDAAPIKQAPRRLGFHQQQTADKCIREMTEQDVIEQSDSPWASPIVILLKKDGKPRFAIDFRRLNEVTRKDAYPLPRIDDTLDSLQGAQWFSSLDLRWGYWNIPLAPRARPKTAFCVPGHGLYQFKRMPFGLCNAPATFQRLMDRLMPREMSRVYLDDIVIPGATFSEAQSRLREVLVRVRAANFLLNPKKCRLFSRSLEYLGHVIDGKGVSSAPDKANKVRDWPTPRDRTQLRSFVCLAQYYARFVPNFAGIAAPLNALLSQDVPFVWTAEAQAAFDQLRAALTEAPILAYPDPNGGAFVLDCDASNFAVGCVLSQIQDGVERVIAYFSHTLNRAQRNYCVTRRELLAIVLALRRFHHYLVGRPFLVRSDHAALQWLRSLRDTADGQLARWLEALAAYDFTIQHRRGQDHGNADALSRRPCDPECRHCSRRDPPVPQPEMTIRRIRLLDAEAPTPEDFRAAQAADLDIAPILRAKEADTRPTRESVSNASVATKALWLQWKSLEIRDGLLCRRFVDNRDRTTHQLVLPRTFVPAVLRTMHDAPGTGGHLGANKTIAKVRAHFYWPALCMEVKLWCLSCAVCRTKKGPPRRTRAPLTLHNVGVPWERVGVDLAGPFPRTPRGNRYLLVAVDYFSKWPEAIPIPSMHSAVVARALVDNIFTRFGSPLEVHSDQGRSFESAVFRNVMELLGTRKTRTTPGRPQSDGAVERLIKTVVTQLGILTDTVQSDWDLQVPLVMLSLRVAKHSTTGVSPAMMMFGHELRLPPTLAQGLPPDTPDIPAAREYPAWLRDRLHDLHHEVRERAWQAALQLKERYDVRATRPAYAVGDPVWLYDPKRRRGRNPKLQCWWSGPHRITEMLNDVVARLRDPLKPRARPRTVHVDRLAPATLRGT